MNLLAGVYLHTFQVNGIINHGGVFMVIISWNLNGLQSCFDNCAFDPIQALAPTVLCCQEIRTKRQMEVMPGYQHFWNPSQRDGYSGTLMMSKQSPIQVKNGLGVDELDAEGRVQILEYSDLYIVNAYAPNSQKNLIRHHFRTQWDDAFRVCLSSLMTEKPVIACGDFNVTLTDIDIYPENLRQYWAQQGYASEERANLETLMECGFTDAFRSLYPAKTGAYTWWSMRRCKRNENRGWRLDYFFVDDRLVNRIVDVRHLVDVTGSDHCPILLEIK
jgi:exodeoxyribonuclease-3